MTLKLMTEPNLEFLSLTGGCTGSSESTHVKMPHCWKSHFAAFKFYRKQAGIFLGEIYSTTKLKGQVYMISIEHNFNLPHKEIK